MGRSPQILRKYEIADAKRSAVVLLRVVGSSEELAVEESYMCERASMLGAPTLGTFLVTNSSGRCLCSSISRLLIFGVALNEVFASLRKDSASSRRTKRESLIVVHNKPV
jgi:hypothetical protein